MKPAGCTWSVPMVPSIVSCISHARLLSELCEHHQSGFEHEGMDFGDDWFDLVDVRCERTQMRNDSEQ